MLLQRANLPVPENELVHSADEALSAAERLGYRVVTKPLDGSHGRGVTIDLNKAEEMRWGFDQAQEHSGTVIVEQHFKGADHRILVIGREVVAVAERVPAHVVGDGQNTILALIYESNSDPARGEGHSSVMTRIEVDDATWHGLCWSCFSRRGQTPASWYSRSPALMENRPPAGCRAISCNMRAQP